MTQAVQVVLGTPVTLTATAVAGELKSVLLGFPEMKAWMADANAANIKKGDTRTNLARGAHLAIYAMQKPGTPPTAPAGVPYGVKRSKPNEFNEDVKKGIKKFQHDNLATDLSSIGQPAGSLQETGELDKVTALLIDDKLKKDQPPCVDNYAPVNISASNISDAGTGSLAARCIEVLRYWASKSVKYSPSESYPHPFVLPIAFGDLWFMGSGTATCSPSTMAALFWACKGVLNGKYFALDSLFATAYGQWQIFQHRQDFPDGAAGAAETLAIGAIIDLTDDEKQAAGTDAAKILQAKVNKLKVGDLVQGWGHAYENPPANAMKPPAQAPDASGTMKEWTPSLNPAETNHAKYVAYNTWQNKMDGGHCFFITAVDPPDAQGNVPGYTILTANLNPAGVSEKHRPSTQWKDIRIARLFKIDGE